jgi:hypothetical protein
VAATCGRLFGGLRRVELVAFPHVEGALGFGRKVDRGNGREGGAVEEDQLEVGLEAGFTTLLKRSLVSSQSGRGQR